MWGEYFRPGFYLCTPELGFFIFCGVRSWIVFSQDHAYEKANITVYYISVDSALGMGMRLIKKGAVVNKLKTSIISSSKMVPKPLLHIKYLLKLSCTH